MHLQRPKRDNKKQKVNDMSRRFYVIMCIFTSCVMLACLIKSFIEKEYFLVFCNTLWIVVNIQAFAIYNRAETIKNFIEERLDEHEKRNNESEN